MTPILLCVQFRNLLPSEELLLFARQLWSHAQREGLTAYQAGDATLCITRTASETAPYEASLTLDKETMRSVASGLEPLSTIEAAFAQLSGQLVADRFMKRALAVESGTGDAAHVAS